MADEAFGEGLELDSNGAIETQADPVMEWVRQNFDNVPDDMTPDTFRSWVNDTQSAADRVAELQDQQAKYEAMLAQRQMEQQAPEPEKPVQTSRERRYKPPTFDSALAPYLTDSFVELNARGDYVQKAGRPWDQNVETACKQMNAVRAYERKFAEELVKDPYAFGAEVLEESPTIAKLREEIAELRKQQEDRFNQFAERIDPMQLSMKEQALVGLIGSNRSLLIDDSNKTEPRWTLAGEQFNRAIASREEGGLGLEPQEALEFVKPFATAAAATAKRMGTRTQPQAFANRITNMNNGSSRNQERPTNQQPRASTPFRRTLEDLGPPISIEEE